MIFGILGNTQKVGLKNILPNLIDWLQAKKIAFVLEEDVYRAIKISRADINISTAEKMLDQVDILLAFGGDGTILSTARLVGNTGIPILGVNLGRLGFLAEIAPNEIYESIEDIQANRHFIIERSLLEATIENPSAIKKIICLNDIVIDKADITRTIRIEVFINEEYFSTYKCDGLITATPTGSTAYSLSASGPIVEPGVRAIIINPICPHSLSARPVIIPDHKEIRVVAHSDTNRVILCGDGQVVEYIPSGKSIYIRKADHSVRWVICRGKSFYEVLRTKLAWGE